MEEKAERVCNASEGGAIFTGNAHGIDKSERKVLILGPRNGFACEDSVAFVSVPTFGMWPMLLAAIVVQRAVA